MAARRALTQALQHPIPRGRGRPREYSDDVAEELLDRLAEGELLEAICRDEHMPSPSAVRKWAAERTEEENGRPPFSVAYARAREIGYDIIAEGLLTITDGDLRGPDGFIDNGKIQELRLISDNRKWLLSKLFSKRYGDKVTQEITGEDGGALITRIELVPVDVRPKVIEHDGGPVEARSGKQPRKRQKP